MKNQSVQSEEKVDTTLNDNKRTQSNNADNSYGTNNHENLNTEKLNLASKIKRFSPFAIIFISVFLFYGKILTGQMPYTGDVFSYKLPEAFVVRAALMTGNLPLFNPYILSGSPMLENIATASLYPLNLILLVGTPVFGFNLFLFVHLLLAGGAIYLLLHSGFRIHRQVACLGGIAYALSGPLWGSIDKGFIASAWLIPLFFLSIIIYIRECEDRKSYIQKRNRLKRFFQSPFLHSVSALTLLFLSGKFLEAYSAVIFGGCGILCYQFFIKNSKDEKPLKGFDVKIRPVIRYVAIVCTAVMLSAPQILPTYIASAKSYRSSGISLHEAEHWSLPPIRVCEYFMPFFFGTRAESGFFFHKKAYSALNKSKKEGSSPWFDSLFFGLPLMCGVIVLLLQKKKKQSATTRKTAVLLFLGSLISFMIATGKFSYLYALCYYLLPGFNVFRHPEKFAEWTNFFLIILGAYGLDKVANLANSSQRLLLRKSVLFLGAIILLLGIPASFSDNHQIFNWHLISLSISIIFLILILVATYLPQNRKVVVWYCLQLITVVNLCLLSYFTQWTIPVSQFENTRTWADSLPVFDTSKWRIFSTPSFKYTTYRKKITFSDLKLDEYRNLEFNAPAMKKLRTPSGFDALMGKQYVEFFNFKKHSADRLMDILSVKYIASGLPQSQKTPDGYRRIKPTKQKYQILENLNAHPRIEAYPKYVFNPDRNSVFSMRNSQDSVLVHAIPSNYKKNKNSDSENNVKPSYKILVDKPGRIKIETQNGPEWIILRDWFRDGWKCVDVSTGQKMPIVPAEGGVMAVYCNSRNTVLDFQYMPPGLFSGIMIAIAGFGILLLGAFKPPFSINSSPAPHTGS